MKRVLMFGDWINAEGPRMRAVYCRRLDCPATDCYGSYLVSA